jgi:uncharacterized membrane protein
MRTPGKLLSGMLVGAGVMYLLDPDRGGRRRALLRDQGIRAWHKTEDGVGTVTRDLRNRSAGAAAEIKSRFQRRATDDEVLEGRVRAATGRVVSHPSAIEVAVREGRVILSGPVLTDEQAQLVAAVKRVRGVSEVEDQLEPHSSTDGVPGLQGVGRPRVARSELRQENWSPAFRLLAGSAGGAALARGLVSRGTLGGVMGALGAGLLARAATNLPLRRLVGIGAGRRAIDIQKTIKVAAPIESVWDLWSNFENFPRFMSHLRAVRKTGERRSHWTAVGPAGIPVEWDAEITEWKPREVIAWRSVEGSAVANSGMVRFRPGRDGATEIDIHLSYNPPAGAIGHSIASLSGRNPKQALEDDLLRLKSLLEEGKTSTAAGQVKLEELPGSSGTEAAW